MQLKKIKKYIMNILYYAIPILLCSMYVKIIFNNSIWLDEAFSMSMIQQNVWEMICNTAIDVHPPLYYLILKILDVFFMFFLENMIYSAKLVSIIPIIILIIISYTLIKNMFGKKVAFLFQLLILSVPQIMYYAIEIRMYTWGLLFVVLCYLYYIKWRRKSEQKDCILMTIFAILAAYTHYFALVPVIFIYVYALIDVFFNKKKEKIKEILISILICCIAYFPWIIVWMKQVITVTESYWISDITWKSFITYFQFPFLSGNVVCNFIFVAIFVLAIICICIYRKEKEISCYILGIIMPIVTIMFGVIVSLILRPIFISRYVVCSLGVFWLSISILLGKYCQKKWIYAILVIIICIMGLGNIYKQTNREIQYKEKVENTLAYVDTITNSTFIFDDDQLQRVVAYYYPETQTYLYNDEITDLTKQVYRQTKMDIIENLENLKQIDKEVYIFVTENQILDELVNLGYTYESCGIYSIEQYTFTIYNIQK